MKNLNNFNVVELNHYEMEYLEGGGPILDFINWTIQTHASFTRGFWDGILGNDPAV